MKKTILIFLMLVAKESFSQNYVFDSETKEPLSSVNIFFGKNMGVITNDDGYFQLPENTIIDSIHFSHLSYRFKTILKDHLKENDTIFLNINPIELNEIVLSNIEPRDIVLKSINKIDENYISPYNSYGFYRQSLQENNKGVEMIEVDFMGYVHKSNVSVKIINARRTPNLSSLEIGTQGGVSAMIENGDFVRNKTYFLDAKNIDNYSFSYKGKIDYNGLKVFIIDFIPSLESSIQTLRKGTLYIDSKSLGIVEIRYSFDLHRLSQIAELSEKNITTKKPIYRLKDVENIIKYKQLPSKKWCLSYLEAYNIRQGIYQNESFDYTLIAKLVINNIKTENIEEVKTNYILTKDFNKAVKKWDNPSGWKDTYKLSLSNDEKRILDDIEKQKAFKN